MTGVRGVAAVQTVQHFRNASILHRDRQHDGGCDTAQHADFSRCSSNAEDEQHSERQQCQRADRELDCQVLLQVQQLLHRCCLSAVTEPDDGKDDQADNVGGYSRVQHRTDVRVKVRVSAHSSEIGRVRHWRHFVAETGTGNDHAGDQWQRNAKRPAEPHEDNADRADCSPSRARCERHEAAQHQASR